MVYEFRLQLDSKEREIEDLKKRLQKQEMKLSHMDALKSEREVLISQVLEQEEFYGKIIEDKNREIDAMVQENEAIKRKNKATTQENEARIKDNNQIKEELQNTRCLLVKLADKVGVKESEFTISDLSEELNICSLIGLVDDKVEKNLKEKKHLARESHETEKNIESLMNRCECLEAEKSELAEAKKNEALGFRAENKQLRSKLQKCKMQKTILKDRIGLELRMSKSAKRICLKNRQEVTKKLKEEQNIKNAQIEALNEENHHLRRGLDIVVSENHKFVIGNDELEEKVRFLTMEIAKAYKEQALMETSLEEANSEINQQNIHINKDEEEIQKYVDMVYELREELKSQVKIEEGLNGIIDDLNAKIGELQAPKPGFFRRLIRRRARM